MRGATNHLQGKRCAHLIGCPSEQCLVLACRGRSWSAYAQTVWLAAVLPESASARKKHTNTQTCRVLTWPGKIWRCYALPTLLLVAIEVSSNIRSDALRESKRRHKPSYVLKVLRPTITTTQHHQTEKGEARGSTWRSDYAKDGKKDACHTQTKPCALRKPIVRTPQSTSWHARSRVLFSQIAPSYRDRFPSQSRVYEISVSLFQEFVEVRKKESRRTRSARRGDENESNLTITYTQVLWFLPSLTRTTSTSWVTTRTRFTVCLPQEPSVCEVC